VEDPIFKFRITLLQRPRSPYFLDEGIFCALITDGGIQTTVAVTEEERDGAYTYVAEYRANPNRPLPIIQLGWRIDNAFIPCVG